MRTLPTLAAVMLASSCLAQDYAGSKLPYGGLEREAALSVVLGGFGDDNDNVTLIANTAAVDWYAEATVGDDTTTISKFGYDFSGSFEVSETASIDISLSGQTAEPLVFNHDPDDSGFHSLGSFNLTEFSLKAMYVNQGRTVELNGPLPLDRSVRINAVRVGYGEMPHRLVLDGEKREYLNYWFGDSVQLEADLYLKVIRVSSYLQMAKLQPSIIGDANLDGVFDSTDLVQVFRAGEYEDEIEDNSTWAEGDWNDDQDFDSGDMVEAFTEGNYIAQAVPVPEPCGSWAIFVPLLGFRTGRIPPRASVK